MVVGGGGADEDIDAGDHSWGVTVLRRKGIVLVSFVGDGEHGDFLSMSFEGGVTHVMGVFNFRGVKLFHPLDRRKGRME